MSRPTTNVINQPDSVKRHAELARLGLKLGAADATLHGNPIKSPEARAGGRALDGALEELDRKFPYRDRSSQRPPEVERLGAYIDPHGSAEGAAKLAAIVELGNDVDQAQRALHKVMGGGAPYFCDHSIWEIEKHAPTCPYCALTVAADEFGKALRMLDPYFCFELDSQGLPKNARGQITAAAAALAEAWSYFRAFACDFDSPRRNAIVAAVGVEFASQKLEALQENWQRRCERAQQKQLDRVRCRPIYRKIKGERVRVYRFDEIDLFTPVEDDV